MLTLQLPLTLSQSDANLFQCLSTYLPTYLPSYYHRHDNSLSLLLRRFLPSYTLLFLNTPLSFSFTNICTNFMYLFSLSHSLSLLLKRKDANFSLSLTYTQNLSLSHYLSTYLCQFHVPSLHLALSLSLNNPVSHVFVSSVFQRSSSSFSCLKKD